MLTLDSGPREDFASPPRIVWGQTMRGTGATNVGHNKVFEAPATPGKTLGICW